MLAVITLAEASGFEFGLFEEFDVETSGVRGRFIGGRSGGGKMKPINHFDGLVIEK